MLQASLPFLLLCPFLVLTLLPFHARAGYLSKTCSTTDTYTNGSNLEYNLIGLLESLYTNATTNGSFAALEVGIWPEKAYGLTMCYNEYTVDSCWSCLKTITQAQQDCPGSATASIFYDECLLRYSSKDFRSQVAEFNYSYCLYDANPNDPLLDNITKNLVSNLISNLSMEAPQNPQLAAYGEIKTNTSRNITSLVQCTRDLSPDNCRQCLQSTTVENGLNISYCSFNLTRAGMRYMYGSCYIQYESFHINFTAYPGAAAPASPPPDPV